MRKIIVGAFVSMDGVMQAPGGPTEDPTKGFKHGGWVTPYFDQEFGEEVDRVFNEKFDLLLGRKPMKSSRRIGLTPRAARTMGSQSSSRTSRSTQSRAQAKWMRVGRARCSCATSTT